MNNISSLVQSLPQVSQSRMISSGIGVWLVWQENASTTAHNALRDFGVIRMAEESTQSLWFSPGPEVFRALARLRIWSKLNPIPVFVEVFPVTLSVGYDLIRTLAVPVEFSRQTAEAPENFEIRIHPALKDQVRRIAGLGLESRGAMAGLANADWATLTADDGLDYESTMSWYFAVKPLGRMGEKESLKGWRGFFAEIQEMLQRLGIKYLTSPREEFVVFPLRDARSLRMLCAEMLRMVAEVKTDSNRIYWPCVMACIPQKGRPFTEDLPQKFNLDWNRLTPDFPHLHYRDAFMLAEWFRINEVRYGGGEETLDSWCSLSLLPDGEHVVTGTLEVRLPRGLLMGDQPTCFYCGMKAHKPGDCPTRRIPKVDFQIWRHVAGLNMKDITAGFAAMEKQLDPANPQEGVLKLLSGGKKTEQLLLQAVFEVVAPAQLRMLRMVWRSRGKDWPEGIQQLGPEEGDYVWDALDALRRNEYDRADELVKQARIKYPRSFVPASLQAILALEMSGDVHQAQFYFEESERLSYSQLQQSMFLFLQARMLEVQEELKDAAGIYRRAQAISSKWLEPLYRSGVCMVKMGFAGQAMDVFNDLIDRDPDYFNRLLVDLELERGRSQILDALWERLHQTKEEFDAKKGRVEELFNEIHQRFDEDHEFYKPALEELERLKALAAVDNYVAIRHYLDGLAAFQTKLDSQVAREIQRIQARVDFLRERLTEIQREASWFPFPKLLREFNHDFNFCAEKLNWVNGQHLKTADNFRQGLRYIDEIEERRGKLQSRLVTLRIIRDSTLFVLMLGRIFIWLEVIGLGLALVGLPALVYFTRHMSHNWIIEGIRSQQWEFQKGLILILSLTALIIGLVKTAISFDKRKKELFELKEQEQRDRVAAQRSRSGASRRKPPAAPSAPEAAGGQRKS